MSGCYVKDPSSLRSSGHGAGAFAPAPNYSRLGAVLLLSRREQRSGRLAVSMRSNEESGEDAPRPESLHFFFIFRCSSRLCHRHQAHKRQGDGY